MSVIDASICTPFKQAQEALSAWQDKVLEACQLTRFEHTAEAIEVMEALESRMMPLVYAHLIDTITITLGPTEVRFLWRYDAAPEEEDQLDISALELVQRPPASCRLTFSINDWSKAEFLGVGDLEELSTSNVEVIANKEEQNDNPG